MRALIGLLAFMTVPLVIVLILVSENIKKRKKNSELKEETGDISLTSK